jgi:cytochrome b pre-mRNA-processing protein 3
VLLSRLLRPSVAAENPVERLYQAIVARAREPAFYAQLGVPDTLDGRFEMIALHVFLALRRLKTEGEASRSLAQALCDRFFADLDRSLREMGAGDLGVGRRVKAMAQAFYGRVSAYEAALAGDDATLAAALERNLFGTTTPAPESIAAIARYVRRETAALAAQPYATLAEGMIAFGAPQ